ncbi:hypothetical protein PIN31115_02199 [Pandoraea iniqua]|uniref:Uncharacterized protein n=1 Tax=Pandoraea iniqua TaxID=2508288 RepID=A0A5E4US84_9BURK|nr:hypothetical protein [Pandoraea iniqua]VVE02812.1 hypothetical protein PIN31115_02199 [Pandoraea iniqua]
MPALSTSGMSATALSAPSLTTVIAGAWIAMSDTPRVVFADDLSDVRVAPDAGGERVLRREDCATWLPMRAPADVQSDGRTIMHLHSEPDRIGFLSENRAGAFWVELLDVVASMDGCPNGLDGKQLVDALEERMACLGIAATEATQTSSGHDEGSGGSEGGEPGSNRTRASEFPVAESMSMPSIYMRHDGYQPGTMAALEYDLGWWALMPTWSRVTKVDERTWHDNPNPALFRATGRDILHRLPVDPSRLNPASGVARILSLHSHAAGFSNCLTNVTRVASRTGESGAPVPAIETSLFERRCPGDWWRAADARRSGRDALTLHANACRERTTTDAPPSS